MKLFAIFASFASVGVPKSLSGYLLHFLSKQRRKTMLYKCCSAQLLNNSLDLFKFCIVFALASVGANISFIVLVSVRPRQRPLLSLCLYLDICVLLANAITRTPKNVLVSVRGRGRGQHNMIQYNTIQVRGRGQQSRIMCLRCPLLPGIGSSR